MKQLTIDAFMNYKFLSELKFAPGGKQAAVVAYQADREKNAYRSSIWLYKNGAFSVLTGLQKERGYIWEDETHILFPAVRSDEEKERAKSGDQFTSYYRISTEGGEAQPAFTLNFPAMGLKKLDDKNWIVTGAVDMNYPDYYKMSKEERDAVHKAYKDNADYEIMTEIPFYSNGGGFTDRKRTGLYLYNTETGDVKMFTAPSMSAMAPQVLNGKIYFMGMESENVIDWDDIRAYVYDPETEKVEKLYKEDLMCEDLQVVDDKLIGVLSEISKDHIGPEAKFYEVCPETGKLTLLADNMDAIGNSTGSDCRFGHSQGVIGKKDALYFVKTLRNDGILCKLTKDGVVSNVIAKAGSVDGFDVAEDGTVLIVGLYDDKLQEVYKVVDGQAEKISAFNDAVLQDTYVASYNKMTIDSEGWDIDGWVLLPKDYDPEKTYPAILDIHGGPRTVYGEMFYHEMQLWANMGYFVMFCNPVGGSGRGQKFADITDKYGTIDFKNIMDFVDAVLEKYPQIDSKRVGCTGGSYGGFMSNWILGHTDRFACVATQRSISNWISFHGTSDIGFGFTNNQLAHDIYTDEGVERLWAQSPLKYINNMVTPTLFIHSDEDYRCPMEQGMQLFTALKKKGVPARFVYFKGENHELSRSGKPLHRLKRLQEITDWMEKYCK